MKPIPLIMLVVGGIMIYAGVKGDNPLAVLKGVLTGGYQPPASTPSSAVAVGSVPPAYVPNGPAQGQASTAYVPGGFKN